MWEVSLPTHIQLSKTKRFALNLNTYRNAHFRDLAKAKTKFGYAVMPLIHHIPENLGRIRMSYILYPGTAAECDVANFCSIVDKFFSDVLVHAGKLVDDNYKVLPLLAYGFGEIDRLNPRVDCIIEQI